MKKTLMLKQCPWLLGILCFSISAAILVLMPQARAASTLLSHYRLNGNGLDDLGNSPAMNVSAFSFTNGAIHLTDEGWEAGYLSQGSAKICGFNYDSFTVAIDFNPSDFAIPHRNILSGGPLYRWIGFENDQDGHLLLRYNNGSGVFAFTNILETNSWHTLICSVDLVSLPGYGKIIVFLDGEKLLDTARCGFQFNVPPSLLESESVFSFWNGGNAATLCGYANDLRVYRRALTEAEIVSLLSARVSIIHFDQNILVYWPTDLNGYVLESTSSMQPPLIWSCETRSPAVVGDRYLVVDDVKPVSKFYRLKSQ